MPEWRVPEIVGKRRRFNNVRIDWTRTMSASTHDLSTNLFRQAPCDLGNLKGMCQAIMDRRPLIRRDNLCDPRQAPKGCRVEDSVTITLKRRALIVGKIVIVTSRRSLGHPRSRGWLWNCGNPPVRRQYNRPPIEKKPECGTCNILADIAPLAHNPHYLTGRIRAIMISDSLKNHLFGLGYSASARHAHIRLQIHLARTTRVTTARL